MARTSRWVTRATLVLLGAARPALACAELDAAAPLADDRTVIALAVALGCSEPPDGAAAPSDTSAPAPPGAPEVELVATVRARTLAFDEVPRADAVLPAGARTLVAWRAERLNLPLHPRAGVVYRDVEVRLTISTTQGALAAMLGEAKRSASGIRIDVGPVAAAPPPAATPPPAANPAASPPATPP